METGERDTARDQARAQLDGIVELINALEKTQQGEEAEIEGYKLDEDAVRERINEDPLSVEVRTDWHSVGDNDNKPTEYNILLCTGGPACRIIGDLDEYGQPMTAKIEYQDWFRPWTQYRETTDEEDAALLTYAQQFFYGE